MKKTWVFIACVACLLVGAALGIWWDVSRDKDEVEPVQVELTSVQGAPLDSVDVDRVLQLDKEYMIMNYGGDNMTIRWYESCYKMSDFLDADPSPVVFGVVNVFQVQERFETGGAKVNVYAISHTKDNSKITVAENNFWVEDYDLFEYQDTLLTFSEAYDCMKAVNYKMPHSQNVTLRWQIGPTPRNEYAPQYIFGNPNDKYFVDGHTGKVTNVNPSGVPEGDSEPY